MLTASGYGYKLAVFLAKFSCWFRAAWKRNFFRWLNSSWYLLQLLI